MSRPAAPWEPGGKGLAGANVSRASEVVIEAAACSGRRRDRVQLPPDKPLTLVAYTADLVKTAYIKPVAVGDVLPDMPLFLEPDIYVPAPLEATYQAAFDAVPRRWRDVLQTPRA